MAKSGLAFGFHLRGKVRWAAGGFVPRRFFSDGGLELYRMDAWTIACSWSLPFVAITGGAVSSRDAIVCSLEASLRPAKSEEEATSRGPRKKKTETKERSRNGSDKLASLCHDPDNGASWHRLVYVGLMPNAFTSKPSVPMNVLDAKMVSPTCGAPGTSSRHATCSPPDCDSL